MEDEWQALVRSADLDIEVSPVAESHWRRHAAILPVGDWLKETVLSSRAESL